jgi:hypothetical protein
MQPRVITAGPLAAASATAVALAQKPTAAGALALNGSLGSAVANNVCLSQSGTAATPLLLNGALSNKWAGATAALVSSSGINPNGPGHIVAPQPIYITSAGNDSGRTFAVVGLDVNRCVIKETIGGTNAGVSASVNSYQYILSITPSGNTAAAVTVGTFGPAAMDSLRRVLLTQSSNTDTGLAFVISGTDWAGTPISETLALGTIAAPAQSVLDYLTVTKIVAPSAPAGTVSAGTSGVGGSQWAQLDTWAMEDLSGQAVVSGTVNYTIQSTNDDVSSYQNPVRRDLVTWDSNYCGVSATAASAEFGILSPPAWVRVVINSGAGSVRLTLFQHGSAGY